MVASDATPRCYRCGEAKPAEQFAWRRRDNAVHRQRYIEQARVQKQRLFRERTLYLLEYFEAHPCIDCGERDPVVLEFDHLRDKAFSIGADLSRRGWQSILDEMEKCEVVCANCHRRRTARRRGALRAVLTGLAAET